MALLTAEKMATRTEALKVHETELCKVFQQVETLASTMVGRKGISPVAN